MTDSSRSPSSDRELPRLLAELCDDALNANDARRLAELLEANPQTQQKYIEYVHLDACLQYDSILTAGRGKPVQDPQTCDPNRSTVSLPSAFSPTGSRRSEMQSPAFFSRSFISSWTMPILSAAIAIVITATVTWRIVSRTSNTQVVATTSPDEPKTINRSTQLPVVTSLNSKQRSTTLQLEGIGYVTLDGPTDFALIGPMRARLNYGRIKMRVTESTGRGFVIETPDGEVTDLGTEFALSVAKGSDTSLIVREGMVDLRTGEAATPSPPERLVGGEAVSFNAGGNIQRIMSIVASDVDSLGSSPGIPATEPLIESVADNLRGPEVKSYYEIVHGGFCEDARAYVDRNYEWNGLDALGMPEFLIGADYILPFNNDRLAKDLEITVTLARPAILYVLFDDRGPTPQWLRDSFVDTGLDIGTDEDTGPIYRPKPRQLGKGPGVSIDNRFSIWSRKIGDAGSIVLGPRGGKTGRAMYGIAAVPLESK